MSNRNRTAGHNAERRYAEIFRKLGYKKTITTRKGSRLLDDCKIDLMFLPFNVQIKDGIQRGMKPRDVLQSMKSLIEEHFPKNDKILEYPKLLIHRMVRTKGKRQRQEHDDLVTMSFNDFVKILKNGNLYNPTNRD